MKKKSIAINYVYNLIYQILSILLPLITTPYISRILGAKQIGIFGYTTSIVTYFILLGTLGISMYGQREIAFVQNDKNKKSKIFWELIIIRIFTLFISSLIFFIIYGIKGNYSIYYNILLIQLIANLFDISWFFQGVEEFDKTVIRNIIVKTICLILIFTLVKNYNDLWKYFLIIALSEFIGNSSMWMYVPKYITKIKINNLNFKKHMKPILGLFLPQIAIQVYSVLDKTMIGLITKDMIEVGYYEQAQKLVKTTLMVYGAMQIVMNSRIANAYARKDKKEMNACFEKSFCLIWLLCIPMMFGIIAIVPKFVPWFYGNGYQGVIKILVTISPITIAIGLNGITGIQYLVQIKKQKEFTKSVIFGCIINILFNAILIKKYGGIGAGIASVIAETSIFLFQLKIFKKEYDFPKYLSKSLKSLLSSVIMFIFITVIADKLPVGIIYTIMEIGVGLLIYLICLRLLKDETYISIKNQIIDWFKQIILKIMKVKNR